MNDNNLTIEVYSSGTTLLPDLSAELLNAEQLTFATGYPGGRYLNASFFVPRDILQPWHLKAGQRVILRNGLVIVYEGWINGFDYIDDGTVTGIRVNLEGAWQKYLMRRRWDKLWADTRIDEKTWAWDTIQKLELWEPDRNNRILISAKGATFIADAADDAYIVYTARTGHTLKRISYDYYFNEYAGRDFKMRVEEYTGSWATVATSEITATGTGSKDLTLSANVTKLRLVIASDGGYTVVADERNIGAWSKICVYTETGTIDLPAVVTDVRGKLTVLNSTDAYVSALASARSLVGTVSEPASFGAFGFETCADILMGAASFGDGNNDRYAVGLYDSERALSPDGKPVIFCEKYPVLTTWDVSVRTDDLNISGNIEINQRFDDIVNWVIISYADENGNQIFVTPDDNASLKNDSSITSYGQRDALLDLGYCTSTIAAQNGYRFLAAYKDPIFELASPITVQGKIRTLSGEFAPVSQVYAGLRLRVENFLNDLTGSGTGATFLISSTQYDDSSETVTITCGPPPELIIPQLVAPIRFDPIQQSVYPNYVGVDGVERPAMEDDTMRLPQVGGSPDHKSSGTGIRTKNKAGKMAWEKAYNNRPKKNKKT